MRDAFYYDLEKRVNALAKQADHNTAVFINDLQVIKCKLDAIENYLSVGGWRLFIGTIINFILRDDPANDLQINFQKELKKLNEARTEMARKVREEMENRKNEIKVVNPNQVPELVKP